MNKPFVVIKKKVHEVYNKYYVTKIFWDKIKYLGLLTWFLLNIILYAIYVNLASTAGYFLSEVERGQKEVEFSYNIVKFNTTEYRKELRGSIGYGSDVKKVKIENDVVYLGNNKGEILGNSERLEN